MFVPKTASTQGRWTPVERRNTHHGSKCASSRSSSRETDSMGRSSSVRETVRNRNRSRRKGPIEHQRLTLAEVQNSEGDFPPPVHEGQDVTSLHLRIGEKDFSIDEPAMVDRQLRDHSLPRRTQKGGLPLIRRAGIP